MKKNFQSRKIVLPAYLKLLMIMKISTFIIFLTTLQIAASTYSQSLNVKIKNGSLSDVFQTIEMQTDYTIFYKDNHVNSNTPVNINIKNSNIKTVLDLALEGTSIKYSIIDNIIVLLPKKSSSQEIKIKGVVVDMEGIPLPGVNITEKGTTNGTVTNINGEYTITVASPDAILSFSFVGYLTEEIEVKAQTVINLTMVEDIQTLEEVVVVGYGSQRRVNLTGAVSVLTSESLENRAIASTAQGLQGAIPNLNINFGSFDVTDLDKKADFNIRGYESINGGEPYVLIDGVPMDLDDINPSDIESISVLKDASAAAIYGGKAAFGVILVTTKSSKGKEKITVKYSNEFALSTPIFKGYDPVSNSVDFVNYKNYMRTNDGYSVSYDADYVSKVQAYHDDPENSPEYEITEAGQFRYYGYNDYTELLLRDFAPSQKHNLSVSGGTEKTSFYVSFGNFKKEGLLKYGTEEYARNNVMLKTTQEITNWLSLDQKVAVNQIKTDRPHDYGVSRISVAAVQLLNPIDPISFPEEVEGFEDLGSQYFDNVIGYLDEGGRETKKNYDTWLTAGINLTPIKNLKIRSELSYNYKNSNVEDALLTMYFVQEEGLEEGVDNYTTADTYPSWATSATTSEKSYIFNTYAEYELKDLGEHYFKAMVGFNQEEGSTSLLEAIGYNLITPTVPYVTATTGEQTINDASLDEWALRGAFSRLNYIYKDRYLFEFSGRYDGSSRFPKDNRFGFFPSASIGYRISEESFMQNLTFIDNLKLRASYGELGNQVIINSSTGTQNYYPYLASFGIRTSNYTVIDGTNYMSFASIPDLVADNLTWETVATKDIGFDFTVLEQRLDGTFDYYIRETKDMLLQIPQSEMLGTKSPYTNGANLETKGWEFTVSWRDKITEDLSYNLRFSMWDSKTKITKYHNETGSLDEYYEGQEIGELWGYETVGLFQDSTEIINSATQREINSAWYPGDVRYKDLNGNDTIDTGDGTIYDTGDKRIIGNVSPRYQYSFTIDVNYKNWSLSAFFQGVGKRDWYANANNKAWWPWATNGTIKETDITDTWSTENKDAYWYRAGISNSKNQSAQTRYLQDASYLRLKSLTLGYSLPIDLINKVGLSKASLFISGQNLWTHSNLIYDRDPESGTGNAYDPSQTSSATGYNVISYPAQRTFSMGMNVIF